VLLCSPGWPQSSEPPASASQVAGAAGMCHGAQANFCLKGSFAILTDKVEKGYDWHLYKGVWDR
jgi:hypothetical protein